MALLFIIPSWILLLSLVVGLCLAARVGDSQLQQGSPAYPASDPDEPRASSPKAARSAASRTAYPCNPIAQPSGVAG